MTNQKDKDILLHGYETARAWSGLLISLSTGSIIFTATFKDKFVLKGQDLQALGWLLATWIGFAMTVLAGLAFIAALIPHLSSGKVNDLDLYAGWPCFYASLQWICFFLGLVFFSIFAIVNL